VTELFEARSPSDPAVVSEIDGAVSFGQQKRGAREVIVTSHDGRMYGSTPSRSASTCSCRRTTSSGRGPVIGRCH